MGFGISTTISFQGKTGKVTKFVDESGGMKRSKENQWECQQVN